MSISETGVNDPGGFRVPVVIHPDPLKEIKFTMCYWDDGRLFRDEIILPNFRYLAISHVWGHARWQTIPGIDGEVLASDSKAKFLVETLPGIVGDDYFWMDILCVDQRDKGARVAVTNYIPRIFRSAEETIFVKGEGGAQMCCADSIEDFSVPDSEFANVLAAHRLRCHPEQPLRDRMLERLWPLEEIMLSNTIQFVNCQTGLVTQEHHHEESNLNMDVSLATFRFMLRLRELANAWAGASAPFKSSSKSAVGHDARAFMEAFFKNSTIQRTGPARLLHPFPEDRTFYHHKFSTRRTSKARDFILAIMPQYSFYTVPKDAKRMTFNELFKDCVHQLWKGGYPMQPMCRIQRIPLLDLSAPEYQFRYDDNIHTDFPNGRDETLLQFPLPQIPDHPEPACLGDLIKLFCGGKVTLDFYPPLDAKPEDMPTYQAHPAEEIEVQNPHSIILPQDRIYIKCDRPENWKILLPHLNTRVSISQIFPVQVTELDPVRERDDLVSLLKRIAGESPLLWAAAMLGEVHDALADSGDPQTNSNPLRDDERVLVQFLQSWWMNSHNAESDSQLFNWDLYPAVDDPISVEGTNFVNDVVRLATLLACGLGLGSFVWSKGEWSPAAVYFRGKTVISLVPHSAVISAVTCDFWVVRAVVVNRWILLARHLESTPLVYTACILPWDVEL